MKNLITVTIIALALSLLPACNSQQIVCNADVVVSNAAAAALSSPILLNCNSQGYATLQAAAQTFLEAKQVCTVALPATQALAQSKSQSRGLVGNTLCPGLELALMQQVQSAVPVGCNPVVALAAIQGVVQTACTLIPF